MAKITEPFGMQNRIFCVDPNNMHGRPGVDPGEPMTPDYTDYPIWCNLVVETTPRLKHQAGGTDYTGTYAIQYNLTEVNEHEYVSFLQGKDAYDYNYLTTDYTDIDFNTVKNRNMVEGLQIESIRISFQNFQCPMVTIKFVDIRGGGFFAREEATHNEYGKLSGLQVGRDGKTLMDNVFGCFTTMPYPRFKLQVKGFYGNPVTFQLTCSSFMGSFNSTTGNFEITTQFIGYEYGVLGDIPFSYIVAAPYTRTGSAYWDKRVESDDWKLLKGIGDDGEPESSGYDQPVRLAEFYQRIEAAINEYRERNEDINDYISDRSYAELMESYTDRIDKIRELQQKVQSLKDKIIQEFGADCVVPAQGTDCDIMVIFNKKGERLGIKQEIFKIRDEIGDAIEDYVLKYGEDNDTNIVSTMVPNCDNKGNWRPWKDNVSSVGFGEYIRYNPGGGNNVGGTSDNANPNILVSDSESGEGKRIDSDEACAGSEIRLFGSGDKLVVNQYLSRRLFEALGTPTTQIRIGDEGRLQRLRWSIRGDGGYRAYAAAIDCGNATYRLKTEITELELAKKKYEENEKSYTPISEMLGFAPYIGNYFKVVMCHLETFIYLFYNTADAIYKNQDERLPHKLGISNLAVESDISNRIKWVPPFPAVYKKYETEEERDRILRSGGNIVETSWVGDFQGSTPWAEQTFVEEMAEALMMVWSKELVIARARSAASRRVMSCGVSYNPIDYRAEFPRYALESRESLAFYTAIRSELMFGIVDPSGFEDGDNTCELLGALDGMNYVASMAAGDRINGMLGGGEGSSFTEEVIDIVTCADHGDGERYDFEFANMSNGRQPVFNENGDNLEYKYMSSANGYPLVPVAEYQSLSNGEIENSYSVVGGSFRIKNLEEESYVFGDYGKAFVDNDIKTVGVSGEGYTNKCMFHVITDQSAVDAMTEMDEYVVNDKREIGNYKGELFKKVRDRYYYSKDNVSKYRSEDDIASYKNAYGQYNVKSDRICVGPVIGSGIAACTDKDKTNAFIKQFNEDVKL